jgi:hypothetical protein
MEHRWGQRVAADTPVVVTRDGWMLGLGQVANISLSGAMLTTALEVPLHANITILPIGGNAANGEIAACVVRTNPGSVAIEWRDMASSQVVALIKSASPDSAALETRDPCKA